MAFLDIRIGYTPPISGESYGEAVGKVTVSFDSFVEIESGS